MERVAPLRISIFYKTIFFFVTPIMKSPKNIKCLLQKGEQKLQKISKEARIESELLLCHTIKKPKEYLFQNLEKKISKNTENKFKHLVKKRLTRFPLAYILGKKEFFGLGFKINQNVLIPRPETEELVEYFLKSKIAKKKNLKIADIGTGCGCIAITIAKKLPTAKIYATDISQSALKVAHANARRHHVSKRINPAPFCRKAAKRCGIKFLKGNLLSCLSEKVDVIIANLPYISDKDYQKYFKNLKFEPRKALFGGRNGSFYIKKLLRAAPKYLKPNGEIFLETSPEQSLELILEAKKNLPKMKAELKKDLSGKIRILHLKQK